MGDQHHQIEKSLTQKQKFFERQSPERQWTIVKPFLDLFTSAVSKKMGILPSLSAISVAMLVVVTLRSDLIPLSIISTKIIISVLIFFIPFSLMLYILEQEKAAKKALKYCGEYQKKIEELENVLEKNRWDRFKIKLTDSKIWDVFVSEFPIGVSVIYLIIIIYLLYVMWK